MWYICQTGEETFRHQTRVLCIYTQKYKMYLNPRACDVINSGDVSFQETGLSSQRLSSGLVHWSHRMDSLQTGRKNKWVNKTLKGRID